MEYDAFLPLVVFLERKKWQNFLAPQEDVGEAWVFFLFYSLYVDIYVCSSLCVFLISKQWLRFEEIYAVKYPRKSRGSWFFRYNHIGTTLSSPSLLPFHSALTTSAFDNVNATHHYHHQLPMLFPPSKSSTSVWIFIIYASTFALR
jgi:hypothetical protein